MPDEAEPHTCTWMAFASSDDIWEDDLNAVQDAQARISAAIVAFEPVSMLVTTKDLAAAKSKCDARVRLIPASIDDLWIRDTGPVFVTDPGGSRTGIQFNFNGWGNKQTHANDANVARLVCEAAGATLVRAGVVLEGGGIEVDGKGTAVITESCVLNTNRNPGLSKTDCERALSELLGIRKVIWLPGIAGRDITDGHTDFYARFASPGVVVAGFDPNPESYDHAVTKQHLDILRAATDANGQTLRVVVLEAPKTNRRPNDEDFASGYINYYICNGGVIVPEFGDTKADANARTRLGELYPGRTVVSLDIDPIASGGGGIHCTTQQEPRW